MNPNTLSRDHSCRVTPLSGDSKVLPQALVMEFDDDWRLIVEHWLQDAGFEVFFLDTEAEALVLARELSALCVVILDLDASSESGGGLMEFLRVNRPSVPLIVYETEPRMGAAPPRPVTLPAHRTVRKGCAESLLRALPA